MNSSSEAGHRIPELHGELRGTAASRPIVPHMDRHEVSEAQRGHLRSLRAAADAAKPRGYAPYSGFLVVAAVETDNGIFAGANVENANYSLTKHAEEVAILSAVSAGVGPAGHWIKSLYVAGGAPCGSCRQFISEFASPSTPIFIDQLSQDEIRNRSLPDLGEETVECWPLAELLPRTFGSADLSK